MSLSQDKIPKPEEISIVKKGFLDCLVALASKLNGVSEFWSLGGDLAEKLQGVKVEPDHVEILTTRNGVVKITELLQECHPSNIEFLVKRLGREAEVGGKRHPVYIRCYRSELRINGVRTEVRGDFRYKVSDWEWGDSLEFEPIGLYVIDKRLPVMPLSVSGDLYAGLGWTDRAEKVREAVLSSLEPRERMVLQ